MQSRILPKMCSKIQSILKVSYIRKTANEKLLLNTDLGGWNEIRASEKLEGDKYQRRKEHQNCKNWERPGIERLASQLWRRVTHL